MQNDTTPDDILIILGDAGINYYGDRRDAKLKAQLAKLPITLFCIHGNHEMRPQSIETYARMPRFSGICMAEPQYPNLVFAVDGEAYEFAGKRCIAIGGAYSVDKYYRLACGYRWFDDEQPDAETKQIVEAKIESLGKTVDVVLSHTCPYRYIPTEMFLPSIDQITVDNSTERWLGEIESKLDYGLWLCGHYHTDKSIDKIRFMFADIKRLEEL